MNPTAAAKPAAVAAGAVLAGQRPLPPAAPMLDFANPGAPSSSPFLNREKLAAILADYNASVGNPLSSATLGAIRADGFFIVAGQQPGLLLGPMYTLLKAITAITIADKLRPSAPAPLIPAFWVASEDHDFEEVNHTTVNGRKITVPGHPLGKPPVGQISLEPHRQQVLAEFAAAMEGQPHAEWALRVVRTASFENYARLCAEIVAKLLPGRLVLIDPMPLRPLTAPVIVHLMSRWAELEKAFKQGGNALRQNGYEAPLDRINLYRITPGHRAAVQPGDTQDPEQLSPGAALRPIVQDAVLPVLATIGGPTELQYLWQIDPLYAVAGVRRSRLARRLSATFLDDATIRRAARFDLHGEKILTVREQLARYDSLAAKAEVEQEDLRALRTAGDALLKQIEALTDDTNRKQLAKAHNSIAYRVGRVVKRVREQRLERAGAGKRNLARVAEVLYPGGEPQERVISPFDLLGRLGPAWIDGLLRLDPARDCHWLLNTDEAQGDSR
jgi:uncharacterized protein YllA (UPF0747 family)